MSKHTQLVSNPQATLRMIKDALLLNLKEDGAIKQFFSIFHTPNSNIDRIKHVYQYLLRYQMMPKKPCAVKCDRFSIETKNTGNQLFIEKIYIRAIKHYNEAIRFAASSSVINITFANRSAVLFNLKKYRESILDINRAIAAGYSKKLTPKLLERKKQCEEAIKRTQKSDTDYEIENEKIRQEIFEFPEKRMAGVSCASSSIDISFFESMGRGIVATEDIQPGQVLVVEDPYMTNLDKKNYNFRCFHCCALNLAMIPCKTCTYVMYCNEKCRNESWKQGHEFECGIMPRLLNMGFDDFGMMISLRILLKAKSQHSSWEELFKITDAADKVSDPKLKGFSLDSENVLTYDINNYRSIYSSGNDSENIDGLEIFLKCLTSAVLLFMLKEYTSLFADRPNISEEMFAMEDDCIWRVGSLLYRHLSPNVTKIPICAYREISPTRELMYGEGVYAFYSLFNHSCCHNTNFVFRGNTLSILAISPIKKGEQVFTHYGLSYVNHELQNRQSVLERKFKFKCNCEACVNEWPKFEDLQSANFASSKQKKQFRRIFDSNTMEDLLKKVKEDVNFLKELYEYTETLVKSGPSTELCMYQEFITVCWCLFGNYELFKNDLNLEFLDQKFDR